jgi:hypothetical protein
VTLLHPPPPTATISVTPTTITSGQQFTVNWSSTNTSGCSATGDIGGSGAIWSGGLSASGSQLLSTNEPGQFNIGVSCQSVDSTQASVTAQANITVAEAVQPSVSLTATPSQMAAGQSFTLTWSSSNAAGCTAAGGGANGSNWSGALATSGSVSQTASTIGTFTYTLSCNSGALTGQSSATVSVVAASSSGGSHGGGGAFDLLDLGFLLAGLSTRALSRRTP